MKDNPTCKDPTTKKFDQYNKIVMNAMSGVTEQEQKDNIEKITKIKSKNQIFILNNIILTEIAMFPGNLLKKYNIQPEINLIIQN